jgi:excisionase family DNA binding protein
MVTKTLVKRTPVPDTTNGNRFMNVKQAAEYLASKLNFVREQIRKGRIPYKKNGHTYVIDRLHLDRFMRDKTA